MSPQRRLVDLSPPPVPKASDRQRQPSRSESVPSPSDEPAQPPETPRSPSADAPRDFAAVYAEVGDGVGLIEVETCIGIGTGFLLDGTTIATVAHVVLGGRGDHG